MVEFSLADQYESCYRDFDSPPMRQIRLEAYGEDIGQHSWLSADERRRDAQRLGNPAWLLACRSAGRLGTAPRARGGAQRSSPS